MAVTNIGIVSVPITDPDRAIAFYVGVLGFELIDDAPMGPTMRWVTVAPKGSEIHLSLVTWFPTMVPGSMKGLLFNSDALDEDIVTVKTAGVAVSDVQQEAWGRYVTFEDPDGNGIILRGEISTS